MLHFKFSRKALLGAVAVASVFALCLSGCKEPEQIPQTEYLYVLPLEENDALIGSWKASDYEVYKITQDTFDSGNYAGDSMFVLKESETSGRLFFKYTKIYDWNNCLSTKPEDYDSNTDNYYYSSYEDNGVKHENYYPFDTLNVGKWYCVSYKDLTETSISVSGAYGKEKSFDTLQEALENFTVDNGYFATYSECKKQNQL